MSRMNVSIFFWFTIHRHNLVRCDTNRSMDIFHTYIYIIICIYSYISVQKKSLSLRAIDASPSPLIMNYWLSSMVVTSCNFVDFIASWPKTYSSSCQPWPNHLVVSLSLQPPRSPDVFFNIVTSLFPWEPKIGCISMAPWQSPAVQCTVVCHRPPMRASQVRDCDVDRNSQTFTKSSQISTMTDVCVYQMTTNLHTFPTVWWW